MLKEFDYQRLRSNSAFLRLTRPISSSRDIVDAEFYIRNDGLIVNADGYYHPEGYLVGNPLYVPDPSGDKRIFELRYRKVFFYSGITEPIPYQLRPQILRDIDPVLDQYDQKSVLSVVKNLFGHMENNNFIKRRV